MKGAQTVKVIFLDFDGVLNSANRWNECAVADVKVPSTRLDPMAVNRLRYLVSATDAKIVISSTWRHFFKLEQLGGFLHRFGLPKDCVIGKTPRVGRRGHEIRAWLKQHGATVEKYVIFDDDSDAWSANAPQKGEPNQVIQTKWETGLLAEHIIEAKKVLGTREQVH